MSDRNERDEVRENEIEGIHVDEIDLDPFADWFMPGYVTEMDYMNALEADDYRNEFDDIEF